MEFRNLATFLKIVENNSFSKAAEQLAYSQSTVTIQIQQLEEEYLDSGKEQLTELGEATGSKQELLGERVTGV